MKASLKLVPATAGTTFANSASIFGDMVKKLSSDDVLSVVPRPVRPDVNAIAAHAGGHDHLRSPTL